LHAAAFHNIQVPFSRLGPQVLLLATRLFLNPPQQDRIDDGGIVPGTESLFLPCPLCGNIDSPVLHLLSSSAPPRYGPPAHSLAPHHVRLKLTRSPSCASTPPSFARYEEPFRVLPPPLSPTPPRCASLKDNFLFPPPESPSPHTTSASQPHEPADKLALITSHLSISLVMMRFRRLLHPQNHQKQTARQTKVVVFASNTSYLLWWSRLQRRTLAVGHTPPITFSSSSSEERKEKPGAEYSWVCYFSTGQYDHVLSPSVGLDKLVSFLTNQGPGAISSGLNSSRSLEIKQLVEMKEAVLSSEVLLHGNAPFLPHDG
jgi:hypothetical protein